MGVTGKSARLGMAVCYFIVCLGVLSYISSDNPFCSRPNGQGPVGTTVRLALVCTVWDIVAGACGSWAVRVTGKDSGGSAIGPLASTLVQDWVLRLYRSGYTEGSACFYLDTPGQM